jgi:hypothetical protein
MNACCHSVQNLLSFHLPRKKKIKIHKTITLPVVLYGCETWPVTLSKEHIWQLTDIRHSFIVDFDSALESLHHVDMASVTDIS